MLRQTVLGVDLRQSEARLALIEGGLLGARLVAASVLPRPRGEPEEALGEVARRWLGAHRTGVDRVVVGLPRQEVFIRHLTLPPLKREELRRAVEYELGRHLPIPADKVAFDVLVQRRERDGRWRVLLVAAPRSSVDRAIAVLAPLGSAEPVVVVPPLAHWTLHSRCCRDFGSASGPHVLLDVDAERVNVDLVTPGEGIAVSRTVPRPAGTGEEIANLVRACVESRQSTSGGATAVVHALSADGLLPGSRPLDALTAVRSAGAGEAARVRTAIGLGLLGLRRRRLLDLRAAVPVASARERFRWVAAIVLGCALLVGAGAWTWQALSERRQLDAVSAQRRQLEPTVAQVQKELREGARIRTLLEAFGRGRAREVSKLDLLRELTTRVPKDAWVAQLVYKRGELEIIGYAPQAQSLIAMLEGSALVKDATFAGDIEQEGGAERFKIRASVVPRGDRAR